MIQKERDSPYINFLTDFSCGPGLRENLQRKTRQYEARTKEEYWRNARDSAEVSN